MPQTSHGRKTQTSINAYNRKQEDNSLETDREKVHALIKNHGPITTNQLTDLMQKPKNEFSGRITELKDRGKVMPIGRENGCQLLVSVETYTE